MTVGFDCWSHIKYTTFSPEHQQLPSLPQQKTPFAQREDFHRTSPLIKLKLKIIF
jgi:hypothetical protein